MERKAVLADELAHAQVWQCVWGEEEQGNNYRVWIWLTGYIIFPVKWRIYRDTQTHTHRHHPNLSKNIM